MGRLLDKVVPVAGEGQYIGRSWPSWSAAPLAT